MAAICIAFQFRISELYLNGGVFNIASFVQTVLDGCDKRNIGLYIGRQMHGKGCFCGA
jgi:hypothetical protein